VIQIDHRGRPLSSSSTPSVMALILETLDVRADQWVLEIGTGTGYNAALLAHLVGVPDLVTTIEVNPTLASLAQQRLDDVVGKGVRVHAGDGLTWASEAGASDRIIVTGSFARIPAVWVRQLAAGGILVMEWREAFTRALVQMHKQVDGCVSGQIVPGWDASFMPLHPPDAPTTRLPLYTDQPIVERACIAGSTFSPGLFNHPGLALWLQCAYPHLTLRRQYARDTNALTLYLIDAEHHESRHAGAGKRHLDDDGVRQLSTLDASIDHGSPVADVGMPNAESIYAARGQAGADDAVRHLSVTCRNTSVTAAWYLHVAFVEYRSNCRSGGVACRRHCSNFVSHCLAEHEVTAPSRSSYR